MATQVESAIRQAGLHIPTLEETGRKLGVGAYGEVVEVWVKGKRYAGKKLHRLFYERDVPPADTAAIAKRFEEECRRVPHLKHRNVVQMIGVHFHPRTRQPTLVMELMDTSLARYLEDHASVPLTVKHSILLGVANGLVYLHTLSPPLGPIVHRDLTANNVLLSLGEELVAKIADLGQARIVGRNPAQMVQQQLSVCPGNVDHMPPEAQIEDPEYGTALDIFSFGVVMLHTLAHEWPKPLSKLVSAYQMRSEVDRRKPYLDKIGNSLLKPLVVECLGDSAESRPAAGELTGALKLAMKLHPQIQSVIDAYAHQVEGFQQQLQAQQVRSQQQKMAVEQQVHRLDLKNKELVCQLSEQKQRLEQEIHKHVHEKELLQRQLQDQQQLIRSAHQQPHPHPHPQPHLQPHPWPHPQPGHPYNPQGNGAEGRYCLRNDGTLGAAPPQPHYQMYDQPPRPVQPPTAYGHHGMGVYKQVVFTPRPLDAGVAVVQQQRPIGTFSQEHRVPYRNVGLEPTTHENTQQPQANLGEVTFTQEMRNLFQQYPELAPQRKVTDQQYVHLAEPPLEQKNTEQSLHTLDLHGDDGNSVPVDTEGLYSFNPKELPRPLVHYNVSTSTPASEFQFPQVPALALLSSLSADHATPRTTAKSSSLKATDENIKKMLMKGGQDREDALQMLVEKYKLESMEKAEVVLELMEELDEGEGGEGYPLYYYVNAARDHSSLEEAQKYFIQPCPICFGCYPVHEMITMPGCTDSMCKHCFKAHFTVVIKEKTVKHFNCPVCDLPDMSNRDSSQELYQELLLSMIHHHLPDLYDIAQTNLRELNLQNIKEFRGQEKVSKTWEGEQVIQAQEEALITNKEELECPICFLPIEEGVTLRGCSHQFCRLCLSMCIMESTDAEVKCPYMDDEYECKVPLAEREIRQMVTPEQLQKLQKRGLRQLEEEEALITNKEEFECPICFVPIEPGEGVTLRGCSHQFCRECLSASIMASTDAEVKCPYWDDEYECKVPLAGREIRQMVTPEQLQELQKRGLRQLEEEEALITNKEELDCPICFITIEPGEGVTLRGCSHQFCRECLSMCIMESTDAEVKCPYWDDEYECKVPLAEREMRQMVTPEQLQELHKRRLKKAESVATDRYHCHTTNCEGFCFYKDQMNEFTCPNCHKINCLQCKAIHEGMDCQEYQDGLQKGASNDEAAQKIVNVGGGGPTKERGVPRWRKMVAKFF